MRSALSCFPLQRSRKMTFRTFRCYLKHTAHSPEPTISHNLPLTKKLSLYNSFMERLPGSYQLTTILLVLLRCKKIFLLSNIFHPIFAHNGMMQTEGATLRCLVIMWVRVDSGSSQFPPVTLHTQPPSTERLYHTICSSTESL